MGRGVEADALPGARGRDAEDLRLLRNQSPSRVDPRRPGGTDRGAGRRRAPRAQAQAPVAAPSIKRLATEAQSRIFLRKNLLCDSVANKEVYSGRRLIVIESSWDIR